MLEMEARGCVFCEPGYVECSGTGIRCVCVECNNHVDSTGFCILCIQDTLRCTVCHSGLCITHLQETQYDEWEYVNTHLVCPRCFKK